MCPRAGLPVESGRGWIEFQGAPPDLSEGIDPCGDKVGTNEQVSHKRRRGGSPSWRATVHQQKSDLVENTDRKVVEYNNNHTK